MKQKENSRSFEKTKSKLSRHLMTFIAGANIVLGTIALPQNTQAGVIHEQLSQKSLTHAYQSVMVYEKLDDSTMLLNDTTNTSGCTVNKSGCNASCD